MEGIEESFWKEFNLGILVEGCLSEKFYQNNLIEEILHKNFDGS